MIKFHKVSWETWMKNFESVYKGGEEVQKKYYDNIVLPVRKTAKSSGYDFVAPFPFTIAPGETFVMKTGIKCEMEDDNVLMLFPRSSIGFKHGIMLVNTVGVIDADYYNNSDNEGHIMVGLKNTSDKAFVVEAGSRIVQGVIMNYAVTDDDKTTKVREGGIGSTGA